MTKLNNNNNNNTTNTNKNYYGLREFRWESVEFPPSREHINDGLEFGGWALDELLRFTRKPQGLSWRGLRLLPRSNLV
jgi:hypothetical protein